MIEAETRSKRPFFNHPDLLIFCAIVITATIIRLYQLDVRPFHHDEAAVGSFAYKLFTGGSYTYNPVFHGPFLYYLTVVVFNIMGDTEFAARLVPALTGVGMVLLVYPFRHYLGRPGWLITAAFFAFSPSFLYYSRFYRNDIFITFFTLTAILSAAKYLEQRNNPDRLIYVALGSAALAFSVTAKENAYVTLALLGFPAGIYVLYRLWQGFRTRHLKHDTIAFIEKNMFRFLLDVGLFVVVFLSMYVVFYSYFFKDFEAVKDAVFTAFSHWYEMHKVERIGGPPYYYLPLLFLYELPIAMFAFLGSIEYTVRFIKNRENPIMAFLVYFLAVNLAAYAYIGEKVPWLILHPLLPAILIAGAYLGEIVPSLKHRPRWAEAVLVVILVSTSSLFLYTSYNLNYKNYSDPAEPLIQASQPPQKYQEFLTTLHETAKQHKGFYTEIQVTDVEMETQLLWQLRHYKNVKWRVDLETDPVLDAPIIIVHDTDADYVDQVVSDRYQRLDSAKMAWYWYSTEDINYYFILYRWMNRPQSEYGVVLFYR
ncbi:MAG: TIGR03663 family protein [ANME-2 cluster archaeon]|nr:TIGR03663 family protein [ANME-2 cluster archaeon]